MQKFRCRSWKNIRCKFMRERVKWYSIEACTLISDRNRGRYHCSYWFSVQIKPWRHQSSWRYWFVHRSQGVNICLIAVIGNWDQGPISRTFTLARNIHLCVLICHIYQGNYLDSITLFYKTVRTFETMPA